MPRSLPVLCAIVALGGSIGCSSGSDTTTSSLGSGSDAGSDGAGEDYNATATDFDCLENSEWTTVGVSRYKNMLGHTGEALSVAHSPEGGTFPVGTFVQLVPTEASVKRGKGFNAQSNDWEFFSLGVSATGTTIKERGGGATVLNFANESCLNCHEKAAAQWDFICGDANGNNTHGCAALPVAGSLLAMFQASDPRCVAAADGGVVDSGGE
jgi:hypothetical protein